MNNTLKQYKCDITHNRIDGIEFNCSYCVLNICGKYFYFFTMCRDLSFEYQGHRFFNQLYPLDFYKMSDAYKQFYDDWKYSNRK
jgi:hypothetical protein